MRVLGLDISSSIIGVSVAERDKTGKIVPLFLDHIRIDNINGVFAKHDEVIRRLNEMKDAGSFDGVTETAVEAPLLGFSGSKTTQQTIITLIRINALTSYTLRVMFGREPTFLASSTARRLAGIKVQRKSVCGKDGKTQVFEYMQANDLSHVQWPLKRNGKPKDFAKDITDAWVIAKARVQQG